MLSFLLLLQNGSSRDLGQRDDTVAGAPRGTGRGKVRVSLRGDTLDLMAESKEEGLATDERVVVIALREGVAEVARPDPALLTGDDAPRALPR